MVSVELTYWLGIFQMLLCAGAFLLTWKPLITVFHSFLLGTVMAYGIVPVLDTYLDYSVFSPPSQASYNVGLLCQLMFTLFYMTGYCVVRCERRKKATVASLAEVTPRDLLTCFAVGLTSVVLMQVLSRGAWLDPGRTTTITAAIPGGPILFRMAAVPLVVALILSYCCYVKCGVRVLPLVCAVSLASAVLLVLLNQRGIALGSMLVILWTVERRGKISMLKVLAICGLLLVGISHMRALSGILVQTLAGDKPAAASSASPDESLPAGTSTISVIRSFSAAEIWPVVLSYTDENGLLCGKTVLAWPTALLPLPMRTELPVQTSTDVINYYMLGEERLRTWYGVNVSFPHELYMNFGWLGLLFGLVPGALTYRMDRWLLKTTDIKTGSIFLIYAAFCSGGWYGDIPWTLQYVFSIVLIRWGILSLSRVRMGYRRSHA